MNVVNCEAWSCDTVIARLLTYYRDGWRQWRSDKEEENNVTDTKSLCDSSVVVGANDDQVGRWWESDGWHTSWAHWTTRRWSRDEDKWCKSVAVFISSTHVQSATRKSLQFSCFIDPSVVQILTDVWGLICLCIANMPSTLDYFGFWYSALICDVQTSCIIWISVLLVCDIFWRIICHVSTLWTILFISLL